MDSKIIKSESDMKHYKFFKLDNGLKVLLISEEGQDDDPSKPDDGKVRMRRERRKKGPKSSTGCRKPSSRLFEKILCNGHNKKPMYQWIVRRKIFESNADGSKRLKLNNDDNDDDDNDDDDGGCGDDKEGGDNDGVNNISEHGEGGDGVMSCVCLSVGVGSMSEPHSVPGLAHYLEHMVFMGSTKFPGFNSFDAFLKSHDGSTNARTDYEKTIYHFSINTPKLCDALDMFAQFFISPIISKECMMSEAEAVDSEWSMSVHSDRARLEQFILSLAKPSHPLNNFQWGNKESLVENPARDGVDVYQELHRFRQRYYVAQTMSLVVYTDGDPAPVEICIREIFSKVPHSEEKKEEFGHLGNPFECPDFTKLYKIVPVMSTLQLELTWGLPSLVKEYRKKPLQYLEQVIGDYGVGSILSSLRKRGYVRWMTCGNQESGQDMNSAVSMFRILIELTEDGLRNYKSIITTIFQYIRLLKKEGPKESLWKEHNMVEMTDFKYDEPSDLQEFCNAVCSSMLDRDIEDVVISNSVTLEFDGKLISECLNLLTADKMNVILRSKEFQDVANLTEKWFGTSYSVEEIDADCMEAWINPPDIGKDDLHLPPPNEFISTDFKLMPMEPKFRELDESKPFRSNDLGRIWYKSNDEFRSPKAYFHFYIWSKFMNRTATESCLTDIIVHFFSDSLKEETCPADLAHLSHSVEAFNNGFYLNFSGFSENLQALVTLYIERISSMTAKGELDASRFLSIKKIIIDDYINRILDPQEFNVELYQSYMLLHSWSPADKLEAIRHVTVEMLIKYVANIFSGVYVEALITGNITSWEARGMCDRVIKKLRLSPFYDLSYTHITEIKEGTTLLASTNTNRNDNNCVINNYYQLGRLTIRGRLMIEMLIALMEEPLFKELRTKRMLGYHVQCALNNTYGVYGYSVTISSQSEKYTMEALDYHIDEFLVLFHEQIMDLSEEEFRSALVHMGNAREGGDSSLESQAVRCFNEITSHDYMFTRNERELVQLGTLNLVDLKAFCNKYMPSDKCKRRKLSVQVVGNQN